MINENLNKVDYSFLPQFKSYKEENVQKIKIYYEELFKKLQNKLQIENLFCYQYMIAKNDKRVLQIFDSSDRLRYSKFKKWKEWHSINFTDLFEFFCRNKD